MLNRKKQIVLPDEVQIFLKAMASETRQQLLFLFIDGEERTVNAVVKEAGLGQSTISEHLSTMKRAGLLTARKNGKEVFYKPNRKHILGLLRKLADSLSTCCR